MMQENRSFDHYFGRLQKDVQLSVFDACTKEVSRYYLQPGGNAAMYSPLEKQCGWYDFVLTVEAGSSFRQQVAGRVETGGSSVTDPAIGG